MNKTFRLFVKIVYYVFTFALGIILAFVLPGIYTYDMLADTMNSSLMDGNYISAMNLVGGYFDQEIAYEQESNEGYGLVIFRSITIETITKDGKDSYQMNPVYSCFLFGIKDKYDVTDTNSNKTKVVVKNDTEQQEISILNLDTDSNETFDTVNTLVNFNYIYFEIKSNINNVNKVTFVDKGGNDFWTISSPSLSFEHQFYEKSLELRTKYNLNNSAEDLSNLETAFLDSNSNFVRGSFGDASNRASQRATIVVLIYFVCVYVLGDLLVGKRYLIRFFRYLFFKITKKAPNTNPKDVMGTDYFTQLEVFASCLDEIENNVIITYHNENEEINVVLTKENSFSTTIRVHAGHYYNGRIECVGYNAVDFKSDIEVESYNMKLEIKLEKM